MEAVANSQDQFARRLELAEHVDQMMLDLVAQNASGGHVVAVAEAARDTQDLIGGQLRRLFQQPADVQRFGFGPGLLEGEGRFQIAVRARGPQDQDVRLHGKG